MISVARAVVEDNKKKPGRPKKEEGEKGTTLVRMYVEMSQKVDDLLLVLNLTTAQIIQEIGLRDLNELHEAHKPQIEKVKASRRAAEAEEARLRAESALVQQRLLDQKAKPPSPKDATSPKKKPTGGS